MSTDIDAVTKWFYEDNMALNVGKVLFDVSWKRHKK